MSDVDQRMIEHMKHLTDHYYEYVPLELRHRYCLLFGKHVMENYESEEEALNAMHNSCLSMVLAYPVSKLNESNLNESKLNESKLNESKFNESKFNERKLNEKKS